MISAATACKDDDIFCFENCTTSNVTQFCNCVVDEVVARNDSESLSNATLVQEFEDQAALILKTNLGFVWCCTFIIIHQRVPQGNNGSNIIGILNLIIIFTLFEHLRSCLYSAISLH